AKTVVRGAKSPIYQGSAASRATSARDGAQESDMTAMEALSPTAQTPMAVSPAMFETKPSLIGLSRDELAKALIEKGIAERQVKMRVQQIWHWLYVRGISDFDDMLNVSKDLRELLRTHFTIQRPEIVEEQISNDGTRKWLLRFPPRGAGRPVEIETVYIPEEGRGTLCISSQVGCSLTCSFCHTGTQRLVRNLTAEEILSQLLLPRDRLAPFPDR